MDFLNNYLDGYFQNVSDWSLDGGDFYIATEPIKFMMLTIALCIGFVSILSVYLVPLKANAGKLGDIALRRILLFALLAVNSYILYFVYQVSILASAVFYNVDDYAKETIADQCSTWYLVGNILPLVLFIGVAFLVKKWDHRLFSVLKSNNKILGLV